MYVQPFLFVYFACGTPCSLNGSCFAAVFASSRCRTHEIPPPRSQIVNTMKRVIKAYEVGSFTENAGAESDGSEDNATTMKTPTPPGSGDKAANQMAAEARKVEL
jgi:hypothetical protein